jgi:transcriptional regulator with XRE-family HTH domain
MDEHGNEGNNSIIETEVEWIGKILEKFDSYDYVKDITARKKQLKLSDAKLADRVSVSRQMVGKWLEGAKPHGKEGFKKLGMALGMDENELNVFLSSNRYPRLYVKNPMDVACRKVLEKNAGNPNIVKIYKQYLETYGLTDLEMETNPLEMETSSMSRIFKEIVSEKSMLEWLEDNKKNFRAYDKCYIPHSELVRFVDLHIGKDNIYSLFITGKLPVAIKNLVYPLLRGEQVAIKFLRSKLIVFGFARNMNESEIDIMLNLSKLPPLSQPSSKTDMAISLALGDAHETYPHYTLMNAQKILQDMPEEKRDPIREFYEEEKRISKELAEEYDKSINEEFEALYTDFNDKGLIHFMNDVLEALVKNDILNKEEAEEFLSIMRRKESEEDE